MTDSQVPLLYFDNHATTSVDPRVLESMLPYFTEHFGNAESSQHPFGWKAKAAVDHARTQVANLIGAEPSEIVFTSGATESIHLAILGIVGPENAAAKGRHIITAATEHKATLEVCARARKLGHTVTILPVDKQGMIDLTQLKDSIRPETVLVTLMHANNEIGTIHPIEEIGALLKDTGIYFHVDAAQTIGKHAIDVKQMGIDLLSLSGHKFYAPKGIGALFVSRSGKRPHLIPYMVGGGQERGLRGGTHNVPGIVGLGKASEIAMQELESEQSRLAHMRDHLIARLKSELPTVELNGHPKHRLCNNVNVTIRGVGSDQLLLGMHGVAYSSASACSSGTPSHVLAAIGQEVDDPKVTTVRFGLGRFTLQVDVDRLADRLVACIRKGEEVSTGYAAGSAPVPKGSHLG